MGRTGQFIIDYCQATDRFTIEIEAYQGRQELPVVTLQRAA